MSLGSILAFILTAILIRWAVPISLRKWALLISSILAIYWMQPSTPIRYLDFWLPTATLALAVFGWIFTDSKGNKSRKEDWLAGLILIVCVLLIAATRYISITGVLTPGRPPRIWAVGAVLVTLSVTAFVMWYWTHKKAEAVITGAILFLIALFLVIKTPGLANAVSYVLRNFSGQSLERASAFDIRWLGFSYVSFRLLHTIRDRQLGRLLDVTLPEYLVYIIFFPVFTAGPIDRVERFIADLRTPTKMSADDLGIGGKRLFVGMFKKFVIADSLALFALSEQNAMQVKHTAWLWVLLYAYAGLIYFDFSGYSDIAIGLSGLLGIRMPENFNRPYLKPNLTQFWNNWHITLTMWFRAYFFNPITRSLRRNHKELKPWVVILITQISTMVLIGFWHGVTWNFIIWGIWHGIGLFIQNRYSEWLKNKNLLWFKQPKFDKLLAAFNIILTFNYVAIGWIWFALPTPEISVHVFRQLFNLL